MPALPIRYSPSGPIIGNGDGGEAVPGEGFTLRIADALATAGSLTFSTSFQAFPQSGPAEFVVGLDNPKPGLRYYAECLVNIACGTAGVVSLNAGFRVNGGAWAPPTTSAGRFAMVASSSQYVLLRTPLVLGSALVAPVLDSSVLLEVQFYGLISAPGTAALDTGSLLARLVETL